MLGGGPSIQALPPAPLPDNAGAEKARRASVKEGADSFGRGDTLLQSYAAAVATPTLLKRTMGGS